MLNADIIFKMFGLWLVELTDAEASGIREPTGRSLSLDEAMETSKGGSDAVRDRKEQLSRMVTI